MIWRILARIIVALAFGTTYSFIYHTDTVTLQTFSFAFAIAAFALSRWIGFPLFFKEFGLSHGLGHDFLCFGYTLFAEEFSCFFSLDGGEH